MNSTRYTFVMLSLSSLLFSCASVEPEEIEITPPSPDSRADDAHFQSFNHSSSTGTPESSSDTSGPSTGLSQTPETTPPAGSNSSTESNSTDEAKGANCDQTLACISSCNVGDQQCLNTCYEDTSDRAMNHLRSLTSCIELNKCYSNLCYYLACDTEIQSCLDDAQDAPSTESYTPADLGLASGNQACHEVMDCLLECDIDDIDCLVTCAQQASPVGWVQSEALQLCIEERGCSDWTCVERECASPYNVCFR